MSSIVSRKPPPSGSTSQAKDFFWMSIRFGTSIDLSRRANVRRVREASTEDKTATPRGGRRAAGEVRGSCQGHTGATSQDSTGGCGPLARGARRSRTPPGPCPVCGGKGDGGRLRLSVEWPQNSGAVKPPRSASGRGAQLPPCVPVAHGEPGGAAGGHSVVREQRDLVARDDRRAGGHETVARARARRAHVEDLGRRAAEPVRHQRQRSGVADQ